MEIKSLIGLDIPLQRLDGSFRQLKLIQQISLVIRKDRLPSLVLHCKLMPTFSKYKISSKVLLNRVGGGFYYMHNLFLDSSLFQFQSLTLGDAM